MGGYLTDSIVSRFTGIAHSGFLSFRREFVVNKEPLVSFDNLNANVLVGYGDSSTVSTTTLTPVSGLYSGQIRYGSDFGQDTNELTKATTVYNGKAFVRVLDDARAYIESGKTESLYFDNLYWTLTSPVKVINYLGYKTYVYEVTQVK